MTSSIITFQLGQCGARIGTRFWDLLADEHSIDKDGMFTGNNDLQLERVGVYYGQSQSGKYVPRAVLADLEPTVLDEIRAGEFGNLFRPTNYICGAGSAGNVYARGHYTDGAELIEPVLEAFRKESEDCDCVQGYQFMHSIGGGTGSGFGSLLMIKVQEEFPDKVISTSTVYPSPKVSDIVVEPYNAVLSIHQMLDHSDQTFILDNEALYDIGQRTLKIEKPSYSDLNYLIGFVLSGITTSLRFPGQLNADLRKLGTNLVPFPRLHFFICGFAPLCSPYGKLFRSMSVTELTSDMFDPRNIMAACNPKNAKYLTAATIYRGHVSTKSVEQCLFEIQDKNSRNFADWIPTNIKTAICDIPPPGLTLSSTFIGNSTAMQDVLSRVAEQYQAMYKRNAFLHWFLGEGMEKQEFDDAESNLNDIISEYQQYETVKADETVLQMHLEAQRRSSM